MSREQLQSRFRDPFAQCVSDKSLQWQVSQNKKKELLHDGRPLKSGSLRGRQEVHHETLCAVIHEK